MNMQTPVFDQYRTREQIQAQLQQLIQELVFSRQTQSPSESAGSVPQNQGISVDFRVLAVIDAPGEGSVLSAAEVQHIHQDWRGSP